MLNECAYECTRQSRWKETTQRYLSNLLVKNIELQEDVLSGKYKLSPTVDFILNERGHIRQIEASVVRDRIVQKTLMKNILTPSIRPVLIYDNYASLSGRGTSFARKRFEVMLHRYIHKHGTDGYILLIDIKKYFGNIDHNVLKDLLAPRISKEPQDVKRLIHYMIDTSSKTEKGLNLGSECPQIFAVYYLNPIDQFVKVVKGMKYYGRYMDDIFIIGQSKGDIINLLREIEQQLTKLRLEINKEKTNIIKLTHGFTWLQIKYNITKTGKILKRISHNKVVRERRRLRSFRRMMDDGKMTENDISEAYQSWRGTITNDHNAYYNTIISIDKLYSSLFPKHQKPNRETRSKLVKQSNMEADTEDLKLLFNLKI